MPAAFSSQCANVVAGLIPPFGSVHPSDLKAVGDHASRLPFSGLLEDGGEKVTPTAAKRRKRNEVAYDVYCDAEVTDFEEFLKVVNEHLIGAEGFEADALCITLTRQHKNALPTNGRASEKISRKSASGPTANPFQARQSLPDRRER